MDHVALDVSGNTENIHDKRRSKSLKRHWNQLSKCQRSCIYTVVVVLSLTIFYLVSTESEKSQLANLEDSTVDSKKEVLNNIKNDPRDVDTVFNEVEHDGQVLEEPSGVEVENNRNQVLLPPKVLRKFTGPTTPRQEAVVKAFKHAWKGYKQFAWGHDHLKPITEGYSDWFGLGLTIVDSIDTIYIMGLTKEYAEAREWIEKHLHFDVNRDVNLFEVTIRVLGGLLSIYHLTQDRMFLTKAVDLADRLLPCFDSESGVPYSDVNLFTRKAHAPKWSPDSSTSEVTTIQLEFRDLSRITGNSKYENAVSKVSLHIHNLEKKDGLVPIFINANTGQFRSYSTVTLGARGDIPNGFLFIGELLVGGKDFKPKMDHLTCYLPGTLALGVHNGLPDNHLKLAEELLITCYQTYAQQPTFLAPEITYFNIQGENSNDIYVKTNDAHNLLRPEYLESLWYMYQFTSNKTYQDWGWQIFQGFENYTKVKNGYTSIGNVRNPLNVRPKDMMESFFLSETLKYLYLLFSDDPKLLDLDKYVVNSEAHPLPIYSS
ncbi:endoplasmic reticulum mannosyl-oligosaccharide 1,2-alpha-mannosidase [Asbolus verrucosus]|uniref:alpha-1,2-Mannosidase n=1 Tax=Asbolus verrucosus TaxID=1661398 RepID=A0A482VBK5_ASBVE|nr:endoplasmic reticulum mannosyl-oligosaccharide 1,2-alpha-mannosidase [Asbolus verrucosus]